MAKLTAKQRRFAREYIVDLNATQAAIRAGYSTKTAYSTGQRMLKNVETQKEIQRLMEDREKRTEITADRILEELATIAMIPLDDRKVITGIVKVSDKNRALELAGKHIGMFTERHEVKMDEGGWFKR